MINDEHNLNIRCYNALPRGNRVVFRKSIHVLYCHGNTIPDAGSIDKKRHGSNGPKYFYFFRIILWRKKVRCVSGTTLVRIHTIDDIIITETSGKKGLFGGSLINLVKSKVNATLQNASGLCWNCQLPESGGVTRACRVCGAGMWPLNTCLHHVVTHVYCGSVLWGVQRGVYAQVGQPSAA